MLLISGKPKDVDVVRALIRLADVFLQFSRASSAAYSDQPAGLVEHVEDVPVLVGFYHNNFAAQPLLDILQEPTIIGMLVGERVAIKNLAAVAMFFDCQLGRNCTGVAARKPR